MSSKITINGKSYTGGNSVIVKDNIIMVDGVRVDAPEAKQYNIVINGDIDNISVDVCEKMIVNGNANTVQTSSGDVECKNINGNVQTSSGDIECGDIGGNVQTSSGDVKAENITGYVKTTSGDIKYRK